MLLEYGMRGKAQLSNDTSSGIDILEIVFYSKRYIDSPERW